MSNLFESADEALDFLQAERDEKNVRNLLKRQVAERASHLLRHRGALVACKRGFFGGTPGLIGSAHPGLRVHQGTYPVITHGGTFLALRHGTGESDRGVYLVETEGRAANYLLSPVSSYIARFGGEKVLEISGIEEPVTPHIEAVSSVLTVIRDNLGELSQGTTQNIHLPNTLPEYLSDIKDGDIVDLNDRMPMSLFSFGSD